MVGRERLSCFLNCDRFTHVYSLHTIKMFQKMDSCVLPPISSYCWGCGKVKRVSALTDHNGEFLSGTNGKPLFEFVFPVSANCLGRPPVSGTTWPAASLSWGPGGLAVEFWEGVGLAVEFWDGVGWAVEFWDGVGVAVAFWEGVVTFSVGVSTYSASWWEINIFFIARPTTICLQASAKNHI